MASSSSSSKTSQTKHHVFLSFRGEDTRQTFLSHLRAALRSKKIETFVDDDLHRGDEISEALLTAIEESKIAVIIFSKEYASSGWCLEELAKIIECKNLQKMIVIPIFYHVDPSDVKNQTGTFGKAFMKNEERFQQDSQKVSRWRSALTEAANLSGFDSKNTRDEAVLIEKIVEFILKILNRTSEIDFKGLVGVKRKFKEIESLLCIESKDTVKRVGIWGMGGIGKTTLARVVFTELSSQFESVYFQKNVREGAEKCALDHLSRELLSAILEDRWAIVESAFTKDRLRSKKVLIVFDDVTCLEQIENLIGDLECFGPGSRIIITSRDRHALQVCRVSHDNIYELKGLINDEALELLSQHAFRREYPPTGYEELSKRVVAFADGVPLALKVLGGLLFGKSKSEWESVLCDLQGNTNPTIQDVLKISYDGLNCQEKNLFLDIAFILKTARSNFGLLSIEILDLTQFFSDLRVSNLIDKSLITKEYNRIDIHDLLQQMGRTIVEQESKDPGKRSRLWHYDDIYRVLRRNMGTEAIEWISLDISKIKEINLKYDAFLKMQNLRFLDFYCPVLPSFYCTCFLDNRFDGCRYCSLDEEYENKVRALQGLEFSSFDITYFRWFGYPLDSLPSNFELQNLVALIMPGSKIKQLWNGLQHLEKLKYINLIRSKHLIRIPDLSMIPNLESLILEGCTSLIEVHPSIQYLKKLNMLNLKDCKSLSILPMDIQSKFLPYLILSGCSSLEIAPTITCNMIKVFLDGTSITKLPRIEHPSRLKFLDLENCSRLESLPNDICEMKTLEILILTGCSNLQRFPNNFGQLEDLWLLEANYTGIRELPYSILSLNNLEELSLSGCSCQHLMDLGWLFLSVLRHLRILDLCYCQITRLPDSLGQLSSLFYLNLRGNNFESIPSSIQKLSNLSTLDISYCERLKFLPKLPSELQRLQAYNCTSLELCFDSLASVKELDFGNCFKLQNARNILEAMEEKAQRFRFRGILFLPGNEIPEWLSFQNVGSSISLELPLAYAKNDLFRSFLVCLVLTISDHGKTPKPFFVRQKLIGIDQYGKTQVREKSTYLHKFQYHGVMSDHVFLADIYNCPLVRKETRYVTFDFSGENYNVKKCGLKIYFK